MVSSASISSMPELFSHADQNVENQRSEIVAGFREYDDMVAMCIEYTITKKKQTTYYFDCYTKDTFKSYSSKNGLYTDAEIETRPIPIGKIPAVYLCVRLLFTTALRTTVATLNLRFHEPAT